MDKRKRPRSPWFYRGRRVGFIRGGAHHIQRSVAGRVVRISTGCVDPAAAEAEYRKFELNPIGYVSPLGRAAFKKKPRGRGAPLRDALGRAERRIDRAGRLYGLTPEQLAAMRAAQGDCCAICACSAMEVDGGALEIDHCHATGKVRGLLCGPCNRGLGHFGDSIDRMRFAVRYLAERGAISGAIAPVSRSPAPASTEHTGA